MPTKTAVHEATEEATAGETHSNGLLSLDDILSADDIQTEYVDVPEWGGRVRVVSLTGEQRGAVFAAIRAHGKQIRDDDEAMAIFYARIIAASLIDENGKHIAGQGKAEALTRKNAAALNRVYRVCARLSGISDEDAEKAKDDLKANPSASSGTD